MPNGFPENIVILGGGTAGWMAASYLDRHFNLPERRRIRITVVEAPEAGRIGVGEATTPTILRFCEFLGIPEPLLMQRTDATLKNGVRFIDWGGPSSDYFHPFEALQGMAGVDPAPSWLARRARQISRPFHEENGIQSRLALAGFSPRHAMDRDYQARMPYAYHLDAEAFADLLMEVSKERGVQHIQGTVKDWKKVENGDLQELVLSNGQKISGDFFVDCSGFRGLLIHDAMGIGHRSFSNSLLCDRAVTLRMPSQKGAPVLPYTTSFAQEAGWIWSIGLQSRTGCGYVYSSPFLSADEAEEQLREHAGAGADVPARHLDMRVGRPESFWVGNVAAIGLAGGFIEPLESTAINMIEVALQMLVRYFPISGENAFSRQRFNEILTRYYDELRDFVTAHYIASSRRDTPFWCAATASERMSDTLRMRMGIWQDRPPANDDFDWRHSLFGPPSWQSILYGLGNVGDRAMENALHWTPSPDSLSPFLDQTFDTMQAELPQHDIWLAALRSLNPVPSKW